MALDKWSEKRTKRIQLQRSLIKVNNLPNEVWVSIKGYSGYMISNLARVKRGSRLQLNRHGTKSLKAEKIIKYSKNKKYPHVCLFNKKGERNYFLVHRLVAIAFIPNPEKKEFVNHLKGTSFGHHVGNLEWATREENELHALNSGLKTVSTPKGEAHFNSKLSSQQIVEIRNKYKPRVYTTGMLAKEFGISQPHVVDIVNFKDRRNG